MGSSYGANSMTLHDEQPGPNATGDGATGDDERACFSPDGDDERAHYEDGRALWSEGSLWLLRVTGAETGGRTALIEQRMARGTIVPPHRHEREDQSFTVLEGELLFALGEGDDERVVRAGAGDIVWVPRGASHEFRVESAIARVLNAYTPAGIEAMLRAQSMPARTLSIPPSAEPPYARDLSPAAKIALWNRFGMVISPVG